jgi:hypothetical protein
MPACKPGYSGGHLLSMDPLLPGCAYGAAGMASITLTC